MKGFMNICDLTDPEDSAGRTYREVNNATHHKLMVGDLVELDNGARLFITKHTRDCDGTPLYSVGLPGNTLTRGYAEDNLQNTAD